VVLGDLVFSGCAIAVVDALAAVVLAAVVVPAAAVDVVPAGAAAFVLAIAAAVLVATVVPAFPVVAGSVVSLVALTEWTKNRSSLAGQM